MSSVAPAMKSVFIGSFGQLISCLTNKNASLFRNSFLITGDQLKARPTIPKKIPFRNPKCSKQLTFINLAYCVEPSACFYKRRNPILIGSCFSLAIKQIKCFTIVWQTQNVN